MCGIAGLINLPYQESIATKMLSTMARRGPDGTGVYHDDDCTLLHSRLAVIDLQGGSQPMHLDWAGKRYSIVYNGELYNTDEIRSELLRQSHYFYTHSDTEVILHAFSQWGKECLQRLNGIFAFAVWESVEKKLFLARDRIGVKPLFYKIHNQGIIFASEIKTILAYPTVKAQLDTDGVAQILLLGPGRIPGSGIFHGINELEPGCYAEYHKLKLDLYRYWMLRDYEHKDTFEETADRVKCLVADSIQRQMVSDVPVGTFLSGGLDSSIISSVCARKMRENGKQLSTFSVDYENNAKYFVPGKFQPNSDAEFIGIMQKYLESAHSTTTINVEQLYGALEEATIARDLPGMADVDFSLLLFCQDIRKDVTVALSGECADEIFGGYPWYRDPEIRMRAGFPWAQNTRQRAEFMTDHISQNILAEEFVMDEYEKTIQQCDILPGTSAAERRIKEMVNLNQKWFMQTLLDRKDRMSMYSGLEVRVPFCDYRIAEYLYGVPWAYKEWNGQEKGLLRFAMQEYLPKEILVRKKSPYPKTHDPHYMKLVQTGLKQLLEQKDAPIFQIVKRKALEELMDAQYTWPWYGQLMAVPQTIAYMLQIDTWLRIYQIDLI